MAPRSECTCRTTLHCRVGFEFLLWGRWVFLFDKVMLVCRKPRAVFEQRYVVKQVYQVAQLRVEPMMPKANKVM